MLLQRQFIELTAKSGCSKGFKWVECFQWNWDPYIMFAVLHGIHVGILHGESFQSTQSNSLGDSESIELFSRQVTRNLTYVQGQAGGKYKREYFYAIDHQGMLFMEDARMKNFTSCFKEPKFLHFFFRRVRLNNTGLYQVRFSDTERLSFANGILLNDGFNCCRDHEILITRFVATPRFFHAIESFSNDGILSLIAGRIPIRESLWSRDELHKMRRCSHCFHPAGGRHSIPQSCREVIVGSFRTSNTVDGSAQREGLSQRPTESWRRWLSCVEACHKTRQKFCFRKWCPGSLHP